MNKSKSCKIILIAITPIFALFFAYCLVNYFNKPICLWKLIFHVDCWGCGITRAFYSLCKLNFIQAWNYNPRIYIVFPLLVYVWIKALYKTIKM